LAIQLTGHSLSLQPILAVMATVCCSGGKEKGQGKRQGRGETLLRKAFNFIGQLNF